MNTFNELKFNVSQPVFFELFKNPDKGFGFTVKIDKNELSPLQIETFDFLIRCKTKNLVFGSLNMVFITDSIGEIQELQRSVESIELKDNYYILKNKY